MEGSSSRIFVATTRYTKRDAQWRGFKYYAKSMTAKRNHRLKVIAEVMAGTYVPGRTNSSTRINSDVTVDVSTLTF